MKKFTKIALTSATLMASLVSTTTTFAAAAGNSMNSEANVNFTPGTADPNNPDAGPLALTKVANLDFGSHPISTEDEVYANEKDDTATVTDVRGTAAGWKVSVTQSDDFKNGTSTLDGAAITLKGTANNETVVNGGTLAKGTAVDVWSADAGKGNGVSTMTADKTSSLSVPGATKKMQGKYTTSLTWSLDDGVANK